MTNYEVIKNASKDQLAVILTGVYAGAVGEFATAAELREVMAGYRRPLDQEATPTTTREVDA